MSRRPDCRHYRLPFPIVEFVLAELIGDDGQPMTIRWRKVARHLDLRAVGGGRE
jgi:hypothetical protein